ncbi:Geranylgeranyl pyrophosphate synthase, partial [Blyttiomyces sp. JEL0837]
MSSTPSSTDKKNDVLPPLSNTQEWSKTDQILLEPYHYLTQQRGKEIRPRLIKAFDDWLKVPPQKLIIITELVQMLHTASLIIDDVEDASDLRRGIPVAHKIYGIPSAINSANFVYFLALKKLMEMGDPGMVDIFTEEMLQLHRGQGMEIYWRDHGICPTQEEYIEMIGNKTGGLLRLAIRLMQRASGSPIDCVPLVNLLGLHFQIRDDYLNLNSLEYSSNKGFAEDLTEGKFSFLVIHCIRSDTTQHQLLNILKQRTTDVDVKKYAIGLMRKTGSFEVCVEKLRELERGSREEIRRLGGNAGLEEVLDWLAKDYRGQEES